MVCQYTLDSAFVVCPGTGKITGWSTDNPDVGSARLWFRWEKRQVIQFFYCKRLYLGDPRAYQFTWYRGDANPTTAMSEGTIVSDALSTSGTG